MILTVATGGVGNVWRLGGRVEVVLSMNRCSEYERGNLFIFAFYSRDPVRAQLNSSHTLVGRTFTPSQGAAASSSALIAESWCSHPQHLPTVASIMQLACMRSAAAEAKRR